MLLLTMENPRSQNDSTPLQVRTLGLAQTQKLPKHILFILAECRCQAADTHITGLGKSRRGANCKPRRDVRSTYLGRRATRAEMRIICDIKHAPRDVCTHARAL